MMDEILVHIVHPVDHTVHLVDHIDCPVDHIDCLVDHTKHLADMLADRFVVVGEPVHSSEMMALERIDSVILVEEQVILFFVHRFGKRNFHQLNWEMFEVLKYRKE